MGVGETRNLGVNLLRRPPEISKAAHLRQEMERIQGSDSQSAQPPMSAEIIEALRQDGSLEQGLTAGGSKGLAELFSPSSEQVAARKLELGEIASGTKRTRALTDALPNSPLALMLTLLQASKSRGKLDKLDDLRSRQEKADKASKKHEKLLASLKAFVGTKAEFEKVFATAFREANLKNPGLSQQDVAGMKDIRAILADIIKFPELTLIEEDKFREREMQYVELLDGTDWKLNNKNKKLLEAGLVAVREALAGRGAPGSRQAAAKARKALAKIGDIEKYKKKPIVDLKDSVTKEKREKGEAPYNVKIPNSNNPGDNTWYYGTKEELAAFNKSNNIVDDSVTVIDTSQSADKPDSKADKIKVDKITELHSKGKPYQAAVETAVQGFDEVGGRVVRGIGEVGDKGKVFYKKYLAKNAQAAGQTALAMLGLPIDKDFENFNGPVVPGGKKFNGLLNYKNRTYVILTPRGQYAYGFSGSAPLGTADSAQEAKDIARQLQMPPDTTLEGLNVPKLQTFPELLEEPTDGQVTVDPTTGKPGVQTIPLKVDPTTGVPSDVLVDTNKQYSTGGDTSLERFAGGKSPAGGVSEEVKAPPMVDPTTGLPRVQTTPYAVDPTTEIPGVQTTTPPTGLPPVAPTKIEFAKVSQDVVRANANTFKKDATIGRILYTIESSGNPNEVSHPLISLGKDAQGIERFKKDTSKSIQAIGLYQVKPSTAKSIIRKNKRFAYLRTYSETQLRAVLKDATLNGQLAKIIWDEERASLLKNKLVKDWPPSEIKVLTFGAYNAGRGKFAGLLARAKPKNLADFLNSDVFGKGYAQTLSQMNKARQLLPKN